MMSDHDDALLDEDFGDEEYDLGNDEEEALLADDYDFERLPEQQTICKADEETDDVLDLGVTDVLDDLEAEEENMQLKSNNEKILYGDIQEKDQTENSAKCAQNDKIISQEAQDHQSEGINFTIVQHKIDLREKLKEKSNYKREVFNENGLVMDDDDYEEAKERRNRFQSERIIIPLKMNYDIPDSLENVVTTEQYRYRNRTRGSRNNKCNKVDRNERNERVDKGERIDQSEKVDKTDRVERFDRSDRRSIRGRSGIRYEIHQTGRYHHMHTSMLSNEQPSFRAPLLENQPSFQPGPLNNSPIQQQQHLQIYQHHNTQLQPSYHHPLPNSPMPGHPHYVDVRLPIQPNQFSNAMRSHTSRINIPRIDYGSRGPLIPPDHVGLSGHPPGPPVISGHSVSSGHAIGPSIVATGLSGLSAAYNCPLNQSSFDQNQGIFSSHAGHIPERGSHPVNLGPSASLISDPRASRITGSQGLLIPTHQGIPVQNFVRTETINQQAPPPNPLSQSVYENRILFSDSTFDTRHLYNSQGSQFNNVSQIGQQHLQNSSQQILLGITNVPDICNITNVSTIPTGHKILINPHFRGNQAKNEAKTVKNSTDKFTLTLRNTSVSRDHRSNSQQTKCDDPYSYFSDVWQETKTQKSQNISSRRSYSPDSNYSKNSCYNSYDNKYKSESQWSHRECPLETSNLCKTTLQQQTTIQEHRISRDSHKEKGSSPRLRSDRKNYVLLNNSSYSNENFDHGTSKISTQESENVRKLKLSGKELNKAVNKRSVDEVTNENSKDTSLKKLKLNMENAQSTEKTAAKFLKKEDELDPEMKEYRKKMEEQKRLREKILREKENRRKLAAMEKQSLQESTELSADNRQESTLTGIKKENTKGKINLALTKGGSRIKSMQATKEKPPCIRVIRSLPAKHEQDHFLKIINDDDDGGKSELLTRIVLNKTKQIQRSLLHKSSALNSQKPSLHSTNASRQLGQIRQLLTNSQRIVIQGTSSLQNKQQRFSGQDHQQQCQKTVIHKQSSHETKKIIKSNIIQIENLAASTTELQIRRMCQGIGTIQSMQMGEGNATIVFTTQSAAMVFYKKYQRKMLDLSLIKVQLVPRTIATKVSTILLSSTIKD